MKRQHFIKSLFASVAALSVGKMVEAEKSEKKIGTVGFEHLPVKEENKMNTIIHRAESRGHANHGWLDSHHTFSFASYMNPERMHFGALRVLNDDIIQGGTGFGTHPHENMEIVSIPLSGGLEHKDSTGREKVIKEGEVQIMSAGTGIYHSEYNHLKDKASNFLQIWVFPKLANIAPRYDQKLYKAEDRKNKWQTVVSPKEGEALWINQDAWFQLANLEKGHSISYTRNKETSILYLFLIEGEINIAGETLKKRDGIGLSDTDIKDLSAIENAQILLMELPKLQ